MLPFRGGVQTLGSLDSEPNPAPEDPSTVGTPRGLSPPLPINSWSGALPRTCHVSVLTQVRGGWSRSWHVHGLGGGSEVVSGILN